MDLILLASQPHKKMVTHHLNDFLYQYMKHVNSSMRHEPSEVLLPIIPLHAQIAVAD